MWQRLVQTTEGAGWVQWAEPEKADGWARRAIALSSTAERSRLDGATWAAQKTAVADAFIAAGNAYRACNLVPYADPEFRTVFERWHGTVIATQNDDAYRHRIRDVMIATQGARGEISRRIIAAWGTTGNHAVDDSNLLCGVMVRALLTDEGMFARHCFDGLGGMGGECDFAQVFGRNIYCQRDNQAINTTWPAQACDPYGWGILAMDGSAVTGAALPCIVSRALPPLRWWAEFINEAMQPFVRRGAREVIAQTRLSVVARNVIELERLNLLGSQSEELRTASHALAATVGAAAMDNPNKRQIAGTIALLAAAAATVPTIGTAAAAILGIVGAFVTVSPWAIGVETDSLGRGRPFYEVATIDPNQPPRFEVPEPPITAPTRAAINESALLPWIGTGGAFGGGGAGSTWQPSTEPTLTPFTPTPATPDPTTSPTTPTVPTTEPQTTKPKLFDSIFGPTGGAIARGATVAGGIALGGWSALRVARSVRRSRRS